MMILGPCESKNIGREERHLTRTHRGQVYNLEGCRNKACESRENEAGSENHGHTMVLLIVCGVPNGQSMIIFVPPSQ